MHKMLIDNNKSLNKVIKERFRLFTKNPDDTRIKTHPLRRSLKGKFAFSIDDDIRIIFEWMGKRTARFLAIGGHKEVYGRKR